MFFRLKFYPEQLFFLTFLFYFVVRFFFPAVSNLGGALLFLGISIYFFSFIYRARFFNSQIPIHFFFLFCFCLLSLVLVVFSSKLEPSDVLFFFYIFLFSCASYLLVKGGKSRFVFNTVLLFVMFQLFIVVGQAIKIQYGIGFDVPASNVEGVSRLYLMMTPGTFSNANDLSSIAAISFCYFIVFGSFHGFYRKVKAGLFLSFLLVLMTTSRASVLIVISFFFVYILLFKIKASVLLIPLVVSMVAGGWLLISEYREDIIALDRAMIKMESIEISGESSSQSARMYSYYNFLDNFWRLGLGSGDKGEYDKYIPPDAPRRAMLSEAPHSLIVELGYWGGWPLLILFFASIASFSGANLKLYLIFLVAFLSLTFVSSSVIGNLAFFWVFFNGFHLVCLYRGGDSFLPAQPLRGTD